jgi:hypothetical protein
MQRDYQQGMMAMARIQHLAIASRDPDKQAEFYKRVADHPWIGAGPVKEAAK